MKTQDSQEHEIEKVNLSDTDLSNTSDTIEEINYELVSSGPLYIDSRHKEAGFEYTFVADRPGEIDMYKRWGYTVVIDTFTVGQQLASTTSRFGSAVTVQSKCGALLVLMKIKKELHDKLMAFRERKNRERTASLGKIEGISEMYQYHDGKPLGEYTITKK